MARMQADERRGERRCRDANAQGHYGVAGREKDPVGKRPYITVVTAAGISDICRSAALPGLT